MVRSSVGKSSGEPAGGFSGNESSPRGTNRPLGIFLILLSALFFSPAGVFSKGVDISAFSVVFWRGLFAAAAGLIYLQVIGTLRSEMRRMDKAGWFAAVVFAVGTLAFISAFKLTSVSNVSLIWSTAPVLGAFVGWVWFGARVTSPFVIAAIAVLIGTVVLVSGSFGPDIAAADSAGAEMGGTGSFFGASLIGDILAMIMTLMMVLGMAIYRRYPDTPTTMPSVLASVILLPFALVLDSPMGGPLSAPLWDIGMMALFALTFIIASVTLSEGSRYLAPGETALINISAETPFAILLAMLIIAEIPSTHTIIGGTIIFIAAAWYQYKNYRTESG